MTLRLLPKMECFPAPHLRTNAFMISHAVLERLVLRTVRDQLDTLALESGRDSITRQVQRMGLSTLVVDRAGVAYEQDQWDRSCTFWQGAQEGLMVADNRTILYEQADPGLRAVLSALTWGSHAQPS